ncbi:MAG: diacylglycerol/lipid kinase family protein [Flavobacteriaceae bacterium]
MERSFYFILNPYTKRKSNAIIETINTFFNDRPHRFCISIWEDHITVAELVTIAKAKGYTSIVACGGDGTVREVGKSLVDSDHTLGIIPLGSGNGIANHFNIPKKINKALAILIDGKCRKMDVGRAHDFYFFGNIGFGIEAEFIRAYQQNKKHGLIGYFIAAIKAFYSFKYEDYLIANSQGKSIETRHTPFLLLLSNTNEQGYGISLTPRANSSDGLLDLIEIPQQNRLIQIGLILYSLLFKQPLKTTRIFRKQVSQITLSKEKLPFNFQLDGEALSIDQSILEIKLLKKALTVLTP